MTDKVEKRIHFIRQLIKDDLEKKIHSTVITRFPPEPNGYLHIGHAKAICLNFGMAQEFNGKCHLRFDDTNPIKEEEIYAHGIMDDVKWLGFEWDALFHSSDYYEKLYEFAIYLIKNKLAYVDSLSGDEIREYRGTLQSPGKESPYRGRSVEENLSLFAKMRAGEFKDGEHVLRAKIDMSSGNINMRDPVLYRIRHAHHARTGDKWCIYPMYDYAHPLSDALENITHSLCSLEFQDHRPLYEWLVKHVPVKSHPVQTEFARLNVSHTITSKRKLKKLVDEKIVTGWDDPRMPTLRGMRNRGYPPEAIRAFCEEIGVSKSDSVIDMSLLEENVRDSLNVTSPRRMCVINPIKVVIENYEEGKSETITAQNHPQHHDMGTRELVFSREIYIDRDDFALNPPKGFHRLQPMKEVRLRNAYVIHCHEYISDDNGEIIELRCTYDKNTLGKKPEGRKVKGVIHWVDATANTPITIYNYDRLFVDANPGRTDDFLQFLNKNSLNTVMAIAEKSVAESSLNDVFQFERVGYYKTRAIANGIANSFHKVVDLKDTWSQNA